MTRLVALDTETTSLRWDRRIWEIGLIIRPDHAAPGFQIERRYFIDRKDLDLGGADLFSLNIGRYFDRHPDENKRAATDDVLPEGEALRLTELECRGAHIIGAVPNFDTEALAARGRANNVLWSGHYHLIDVENLAVGWLRRQAAELHAAGLPTADLMDVVTPPWKSDELFDALGVKVPDDDRHTALGDARAALAVYDMIMGV